MRNSYYYDLRMRETVTPPPPPPPPPGNRPTITASYGPNGTHLPTVAEMPVWMGEKAPNEIACDPNWTAIKNAVNSFTAAQVAAGATVRVRPGTIAGGNGAATASTAAVTGLGSASWTKAVLICPRDGYGTVTIGGGKGHRVSKSNRVAFIGFKYDDSWLFTECYNVYQAWSAIQGHQVSRDANNVRLYEIVTGFARPYTGLNEPYDAAKEASKPNTTGIPGYGDAQGFRPYTKDDGTNGTVTNIYRFGCLGGPSIKSVMSGSHNDTMQFERSGGSALRYGDWYNEDCMDFPSSSQTYLLANDHTEFRHCWLSGGRAGYVVMPRKRYSATDPDFQYVRDELAGKTTAELARYHPNLRTPNDNWSDIDWDSSEQYAPALFSGGGTNRYAFDCFFVGSAGSGGWQEVQNTRLTQPPQTIQQPKVGAWIVDTSLSGKTKEQYWAIAGGDPTSPTRQAAIWSWAIPAGIPQ